MTTNNFILASDFCDSVRDGTHDTPKQTNSGYRLVTSKHIKNGQINSEEGYFISEKDYYKINERSLVEQWDILMSMIGTIGEAAIVKEQPNYAIKNVALFKCGDELKAKWLYYYLCSPDGKGQLFGNQKGASQQFISLTQLRNFKIPVRDYLIMKNVTDILSTYDDLIENNQKQIKLLEEAAMRLYKEWFVYLRFPGHETTKIVDDVPEGWQLGKLEDLIEVKYGKDHKKVADGDIPVYGSGGLMRKCNRFLHDGESVLIPRKGSLNHIMYVNEKFWTVDTMFFTQMKCNNIALYIYFFMCSFDMYSMNIGAAVPSMTTNTLNGLDVLIPEKTLLESFDNIVQICFQRIAVLENQNEKAKLARDKLLPKLMSGEIEV